MKRCSKSVACAVAVVMTTATPAGAVTGALSGETQLLTSILVQEIAQLGKLADTIVKLKEMVGGLNDILATARATVRIARAVRSLDPKTLLADMRSTVLSEFPEMRQLYIEIEDLRGNATDDDFWGRYSTADFRVDDTINWGLRRGVRAGAVGLFGARRDGRDASQSGTGNDALNVPPAVLSGDSRARQSEAERKALARDVQVARLNQRASPINLLDPALQEIGPNDVQVRLERDYRIAGMQLDRAIRNSAWASFVSQLKRHQKDAHDNGNLNAQVGVVQAAAAVSTARHAAEISDVVTKRAVDEQKQREVLQGQSQRTIETLKTGRSLRPSIMRK